ncbi:MAG: ATP-binding protein [Gammaproteobacteria bacterium]|nr:MAG: ATP-binding protein [Gammaproteobacteria bacterium]
MNAKPATHPVDLVVHIDDTLGEQRRQDIELAMRQEAGVLDAHFTRGRPHLMVVEYDPDAIDSFAILRDIHRQSVHAELVGPV